MRALYVVLLSSILLFVVSCGGNSTTSNTPPTDPTGPSSPGTGDGTLGQVKHIIWTVQEFKSFDVYFGKLNDYRLAHGLPADTDGLPTNASNPSLDGTTQVAPFHLSTVCIENDSPGWNESRRDINRYNPDAKTGPLDGFVYTAGHYALDENASGSPHVFTDVQGLRAIGYYTEREIPYYYFLATQFAISDRFFGTILSRTPPNRIANFAASALGVVNQAPTGAVFSQKTIFHLLDEAGITWKIYQNQGTYLGYFQPFYNNHKDLIASIDQYFTDLKNGTLPQVAYIEPQNTTNEHPGTNVQNGAAHVADLIDALMKSSAWKDSAFFLSYDHGGLYDHVLPQPTVNPDNIPPQLDPTHRVDDYSRTGFRVPLMVVSPFARKGYVSHTVMDQTAVLKFIEKRFDLPTLTARDAAQPDMTEFLDLTNVPNQSAPTPPVQPTDGPCTLNKLP